MSQTHSRTNKDSLCACLENFLSESGMNYARRVRNNQKDTVFNIILSSPEKDLFDQRILIYVNDDQLYLEAPVCIISCDNTDLAVLVNTLNNRYAIGAFQYSPRKGLACFAHYVAAQHGAWPGNKAVSEAISLAQRMSSILYHEMLSVGFQSPTIDS